MNVSILPLIPTWVRWFKAVLLSIVSNAFSISKNMADVVAREVNPFSISVVKAAIGSMVLLCGRKPY